MSLLGLVLLLGAGQVDLEHDTVKEQLEEERAAFERLKAEKASLTTLLEALEQLARQSAHSTKFLQKKVQTFEGLKHKADVQLEALEAHVAKSKAAVAPKLLGLYRLTRRKALVSLFETSDLSAFLRQQRVLSRLVEADVAALRSVSALERFARIEQSRVERLTASSHAYAQALKNEQAIGQARLVRFQEMLAQTNAEANLKSRSVADLAASERELAEFLAEDRGAVAVSGFRSLKGKLPLPTKGLIEVGFGKVINPRFNTVTVQKGLDLRAPLGADVVTVAAGTVVFVGWLKGYGNVAIVDHGNDFHTVYAHLANVSVELGTSVDSAQRLGQVGDTGSLKGPFLYFEIRRKGQAVDPQLWLESED